MNRTARRLAVLVLAALVVVLSVAGSATAAKLVTGKQIRNGSVAGIDIRNGSLTGTDLENGTVGTADLGAASVAGQDLAPESVTTDHLATDAKVYAYGDGLTDVDLGNCPDQSLSLCPALTSVLTSGPQLVTITGTLDNQEAAVPTPTRCGLVHDGQTLSTVRFAPAADGQPGDVVPFTLQAVADVAGGGEYVELRCTQFAGDDLHLLDVRKTAVDVHSLD